MAEIAKALLAEVRILILDEPAASLTEGETRQLFALVERLKAQGVGIIYVSHRLAEIRQLADRITVLRDGRRIATVDAAEVDDRALIELMTGRAAEAIFPAIHTSPGAVRFEVEGLSTVDGTVRDASLAVRAGEIVGIAGLVGCGKSELIRAAFGLERIASGTIRVGGHALTQPTPAAFQPSFPAPANLVNVLRSPSYLVIAGAGQMLVLIVGGFDLSVGAVLALWFVQSRTVLGRVLFATGGNPHAALVSGVPVRAVLVTAYALCSLLASLTGLLLTAQIGSGQATTGESLTLESIAAAVIAGVSLRGGVSRIELVALGAVFLLTLTSAMDLMHVDSKLQLIALGFVLVAAVAVGQLGEWLRGAIHDATTAHRRCSQEACSRASRARRPAQPGCSTWTLRPAISSRVLAA